MLRLKARKKIWEPAATVYQNHSNFEIENKNPVKKAREGEISFGMQGCGEISSQWWLLNYAWHLSWFIN
jgi:hypothetical protein